MMNTNQTGERAPSQTIAAVILAAGRSSRMGEHKLLLPLGGKPVVAWSIEAAIASVARPVILALGRDADAVRRAAPAGEYMTVVNPRYADGMGTTLAASIQTLDTIPSDSISGAVILLADQPLMTAAEINATVRAAQHEPDRIAMGRFPGATGHPVYLPRRLFSRLKALTGDQGARQIIADERDTINWVEHNDARAILDIDTPEDFQRAQALVTGPQSGGDQ